MTVSTSANENNENNEESAEEFPIFNAFRLNSRHMEFIGLKPLDRHVLPDIEARIEQRYFIRY